MLCFRRLSIVRSFTIRLTCSLMVRTSCTNRRTWGQTMHQILKHGISDECKQLEES